MASLGRGERVLPAGDRRPRGLRQSGGVLLDDGQEGREVLPRALADAQEVVEGQRPLGVQVPPRRQQLGQLVESPHGGGLPDGVLGALVPLPEEEVVILRLVVGRDSG